VSISNKTERSIIDLYPNQENKITRIYNGYDYKNILRKAAIYGTRIHKILEDSEHNQKIKLLVGMHYLEGFSRPQYNSLCELNYFLMDCLQSF